MAFASKLGNILKNAINTTPSLYQSIRCMSSSKLFIGGISYSTDDQSLREAFTKYGEVVEARVIMDRETGRSRGFGFVTFTSSEEASAAITEMDGQNLHGRIVKVNYANDRSSGGFRSGYGGGGGYGGAGYGGGNYGGGYGDGGGNYSGGGGSNYAGGYGDGGGNYSGGGGGNYGGGNYGGGGGSNYGGGNYGGGGVGNYGGGGGGSYGGGVGDANYSVAGRSDGNFGGNYAGSNGGLPSYNSEGGAYSNNTGVDSHSTGGGYANEDAPPLDDMKDDDLEPDDYANKRS